MRQLVSWFAVLLGGAGLVWIWFATGDVDTTTKIAVTFVLGALWIGVLVTITNMLGLARR